jgi:hypothetical protein
MKSNKIAGIGLVLMACGGSELQEDTSDPTGCGEPTSHDVVVVFAVVEAAGNGVSNLEVHLEDRAWNPGVLGTGQTDGNGLGELLAEGVTDLPHCWGTMLDYVVVVEDPSNYYISAEKPLNSYLFGAISDGSLKADFTAFPILVSAE